MATKHFKLAIFSALFVVLFVSCEDDDKVTTMPADEARQEIRDASKAISDEIEEMFTAPAVGVMDYFFYLVGEEPFDLKSFAKAGIEATPKNIIKNSEQFTFKHLELKTTKAEIDPIEDNGVYEYDFTQQGFVLENPDVNYLEFRFPADQIAYNNKQLNAVFRLEEILVAIDNYGDPIPTKIDFWLKVDEETILSLLLDIQLDNDYEPTSISLELFVSPYIIEMSFSGDFDTSFTSTMSMKVNGSTLMSYSVNGTFVDGEDSPEQLSGYIQFTPIKFDGSVYPSAIENHFDQFEHEADLNIDYLNDQLNIDVIQTEINGKIGHLEFFYGFMGNEPAKELHIIIVYSDDSWDFIEDAMSELSEWFDMFDDDWK